MNVAIKDPIEIPKLLPSQNRTRRILLIDDTELIIQLERSILERIEGVEVLVANSGPEALQIIETKRPELILLDFHMKGMNGDECCRRIKENELSSETPVIIVTSGGNENDFTDCWEAGCDGIITKPINSALLQATARKHLKITRNSERYSVANVKINYGTGNQTCLSDYCVNMSLGGMFLETETVLPVKTKLTMEFILPNNEDPINCKAEVVWTNGPIAKVSQQLPAGIGLRFINLRLDDLHTIRDFLSARCLKPVW